VTTNPSSATMNDAIDVSASTQALDDFVLDSFMRIPPFCG
jgi:hypothetical protein